LYHQRGAEITMSKLVLELISIL